MYKSAPYRNFTVSALAQLYIVREKEERGRREEREREERERREGRRERGEGRKGEKGISLAFLLSKFFKKTVLLSRSEKFLMPSELRPSVGFVFLSGRRGPVPGRIRVPV